MPQPCDEWHALIRAAHTAGCEAARQRARRVSTWRPDRTGSIDIHIEPLASPLAVWLHRTRRAIVTGTRTGVRMPITLTTTDLQPVEDAHNKAHCLLVTHAYAVAYCTVLADEAGVTTEIRLKANSVPVSTQASRLGGVSESPASTSLRNRAATLGPT